MNARLLSVVLLVGMAALAISGCESPRDDSPMPTPTPTPGAALDVSTDAAVVEAIDVATLESFPVQVIVTIRGTLPDACTVLREPVSELRGDNTWVITLPTVRDPNAICAQAVQPFEIQYPLQVIALPAGEYAVQVGDQTGSFTLAVDNTMPGGGGIVECPVPEVGQQALINEQYGYCLIYPAGYQVKQTGSELNSVVELEGEQRVRLVIDASQLAEGRSASDVATALIEDEVDVTPEDLTLGGEPGIMLEGVPDRSVRWGIVVHGDRVYTLQLTPLGSPRVSEDLNALWSVVTGSFTFLP